MQSERPIWLALLVLLLARFLLAYSFDLAPEEAYWAGAADRLERYFPLGGPVPALLAMFGTFLFGMTEFGVRFPVVILGLASALCFYRLVRSTIDGGTAAWAVLALLVCPFFHVGSTMLTAPGVAFHFSIIGIYFLWMALLRLRGSVILWIASALSLGTGTLSHPVALLPLFSMLLALVLVRRWRARWRGLGPWLWIFLVALILLPPLVWLVRSGPGLAVGLGLAAEFRDPSSLEPSELGGRLLEALAGFSPLLLLGSVFASVIGLREYLKTRDYGSLFLAALALPCLFAGLALAIESRTGVLWLAPGFALGLGLLAERWPSRAGSRSVRVLLRTTALLWGAILSLGATCPDLLRFFLPMQEEIATIPGKRAIPPEKRGLRDPSTSVRGWRTVGAHVGKVAEAAREKMGGAPLLLLADGWKTAAELEFYLEAESLPDRLGDRHPLVHPIARFGRPGPYAAWPSYAMLPESRKREWSTLGRHALLVIDGNRRDRPPQSVIDAFERVEKISEAVVIHGKVSLRRITVYLCAGYRGERM